MRYCGLSVLAGNCDFPDTEIVLGHGSRVAIPAIEVTDKICAQCVGRPFTIYNVAVALNMETELIKSL